MNQFHPNNTSAADLDSAITIHQLREPVPVHLQGQFFGYVRYRREELSKRPERFPQEGDLIRRITQILEERPLPSTDRLMLYFSALAARASSIEALRFVEALVDKLTDDPRYLALMTELEIKMRVYEDLTEKPQAIIASGLGGEGNLIRINGAVMHRSFAKWEPYQRDLLHSVLHDLCVQRGGFIEEELWGEEYYGFRMLLPYDTDLRDMIQLFVSECNQYGAFIHPSCHVTNMTYLTHELIHELIASNKRRNQTSIDLDQLLQDITGSDTTLPSPPQTED